MTFRKIQNSTTADAADMNDNFYEVAQGSVNPKTGEDLDDTDNTNDLGTSSYKWDNVYSNGIYVSDLSKMVMFCCLDTELNSATSEIQLTNLDFEKYDYELHLYTDVDGTKHGTWIHYNDITSATEYSYAFSSIYQYSGAMWRAWRNNSSTNLVIANSPYPSASSNNIGFTKVLFAGGKTSSGLDYGIQSHAESMVYDKDEKFFYMFKSNGTLFANGITETITSITLYNIANPGHTGGNFYFNAGTKIRLFRMESGI